LRAAAGEPVEALKGEHEVGAALIVGDSVDLVDDDGADTREHLAGLLGGEENVERLWGSDEDVGTIAEHAPAVGGVGIARAEADADGGEGDAAGFGERADFGEGTFEVLVDVVAEGFQRGAVDDFGVIGEIACAGASDEVVDADEEAGKSFAGTGGGGDENVVPVADDGPSLELGLGGRTEAVEPFLNEGIEGGQHCS
jgi:hypothetical protein